MAQLSSSLRTCASPNMHWIFRLSFCLLYLTSGTLSLQDEAYDPEECRTSGANSSVSEYQGKVNVAYDGTPCLPWIEHPRFYQRYWSKARALKESNYCRNPDNDIHGPWCVVQKTTFKYCNIPRCAQDVGCYEGNGQDYHGEQDRTVDGVPCKVWRLPNAMRVPVKRVRFRYFQHGLLPITLKSTDTRLDNFKSCRNPGGTKGRPWCYTFSMTASRGEKQLCDVPKCSDASTLGYPLYDARSGCAFGFIRQLPSVKIGNKNVRSPAYCLAPHRALHLSYRTADYGNFTDFCFHLIGPTTNCPAGFQKKQRFLPNVYKLTHVYGPMGWRTLSDNLLQIIYCCSERDYFNASTKPYIMMEKISRYKAFEQVSTKGAQNNEDDHWDFDDLDDTASNATLTTIDDVETRFMRDEESSYESVPAFTSVRRCPPVEGFKRVMRMFYPDHLQNDSPDKLLPPMTDEIVCEYHKLTVKPQNSPKKKSEGTSSSYLALFVDEFECPVGYTKMQIPQTILTLLGQRGVMCVSTEEHQDLPHGGPDSYCLPVVTKMDQSMKEGDPQPESAYFDCPTGFRSNVIHTTNPDYKQQLCCSIPTTGDHVTDDKPQAPLGFSQPFSVIRNGIRCPTFYNGKSEMHSHASIPTLTPQSVEKIELIGSDEPVKFSGSLAVGICHYLPPEVKLGVKSLSFRCEGLGHSWTMTFFGGTCGVDIADGAVFPQGKYCLLQIASDCPQGFTQHNKLTSAGMVSSKLDKLCCRNEESLGAIRLPFNLEAPFKLPAVYEPCQAIEGFNVDAELNHCVYYPQGGNTQTLLVWPRVTRPRTGEISDGNSVPLVPKHCAMMPRKREKPKWNQMSEITSIILTMMQDKWLIYKRPRFTNLYAEREDVCFAEIAATAMPEPPSSAGYCVFAFGTCPASNFELVGSSPYMNSVLCCTTGEGRWSPSDAQSTRPVHAFVTLGSVTTEDKNLLHDASGTLILPVTTENTGCPHFEQFKLDRRVVDIIPVSSDSLTELFNVTTSMTAREFSTRTGILMIKARVVVIYCEYTVPKEGSSESINTGWPIANFAIPKSMADCPPNSKSATIHHRQDQRGFHYSQPIHLDGVYLEGERDVTLQYCVFTSDPYRSSSHDDLPAGHYCVLRVRGYCPLGFEHGVLSVLEGPESISRSSSKEQEPYSHAPPYQPSAVYPDIDRVRIELNNTAVKIDRLDYHFCCRADSISVDSPIEGFPSDRGSFYLYRVGDKCQQINGTRVTEEHICLDTPNKIDPAKWTLLGNQSWAPYTVKGLTPARIPFHRYCDVEINLCYYEQDAPVPVPFVVKLHNLGQWPLGEYALPNVHRKDPLFACPPGFTANHMSLMDRPTLFFELEIMPASLGPYFIELIGHNFTALNVHYCSRDKPEDDEAEATQASLSYEEKAAQWPPGDYCVISDSATGQCPPGLDRHTRSIAELCCRTDDVDDPGEVEWPFINDFFLFGTRKCLRIKDTHVDRYLVRLATPSKSKPGYQWNVLCHYLPTEWLREERFWPTGDYMLPIGRRSGLRTAVVNTVNVLDRIHPEHLQINRSLPSTNATGGNMRPRYKCPDSFQRARFNFVSKTSESREVPELDGPVKKFRVVAMTAMEFCLHDNYTIVGEDDYAEWPSGDYCVFTMNKECPRAMRATVEVPLKIPRFVLKSIDIVDEFGDRVANHVWHENPHTNVDYFMQCCRQDRSLVLLLPKSEDGFYLDSSNGLCSRIPGTILDREEVTSYLTSPLSPGKLEPPNNLLKRSLVSEQSGIMSLCYYHPVKETSEAFSVFQDQLATSFSITESDLDRISALCGCTKNAFCLPYKHGECICKPGYFGDGRHTCRQITPLTDQCADLCDPMASCAERGSRQFLSHTCSCRAGYVGDGFTCKPSCAVHDCQQFSRCVENVLENTVRCECIAGTVQSEDRCHLDIFKTIQHEKDLPQFLIHYDHCLSKETQMALKEMNPSRYFYLFVPDENIESCHDMTSHIVVRRKGLTEEEIRTATQESPIILVTENQTVIELYRQNGSWFIDGHMAQRNPSKFVNGEMYMLSAPLKRSPHVPSFSAYYIVQIVCSLILIASVCGLVCWIVLNRNKLRTAGATFRSRVFSYRRPWRRPGESILVEFADGEEGEETDI